MSKKSDTKVPDKKNGGGTPVEEKKAVQQVTVTVFEDGSMRCDSMPELSLWAILGLLAILRRQLGG